MEQEQKRGRGRPPLVSPAHMRQLRMLYKNRTNRNIQGHSYAAEAMQEMRCLASQNGGVYPAPTWLVDWEGADRNKQGAVKYCVLEELGRMLDAGMDIAPFVEALETQDHGLTAKAAAAWLRAIRLGRTAVS
jgi:hypothetical protein